MVMQITSEQTANRTGKILGWSSRIMELTCVRAVIFSFALLHNPVPVFGVTLPVTSSVKLAWNPSISTNVVGYNVYYGLASGVYSSTITVAGSTATNATVTGLVQGTTYYFAATAVDALGDENPFSNEASYSVPTGSTSNSLPTLNALANVAVNENAGMQSVNLSGISGGAGNGAQTLTVTAVSGNPGLIPNPTVTYTSPNATGSLYFTPLANSSGTAVITVTVNNGGSSNNVVTQSFTVSVSPVNQAPALDPLNDLTVVQGSSKQTISLTGISSGMTNTTPNVTVSATSSNTKLIPTPTISYTSPNSTGTLSFRPSSSTTGTSVIAVTVNNGQSANNTITRQFTVTVVTTATAAAMPTTLATKAPPISGQFAFTVNGVSGYKYVVKVSTNLTSWVSVLTNTAPFMFVDTNASQFNQRFYRSFYLP